LAFSLALASILSVPAQAAQLSYHKTEPVPGPHDVALLVGAAQDRNNVGGDGFADGDANDQSTYVSGLDRPHQGQTFTTGANPAGYQVKALWVRHAGYSPANVDSTWWCAPKGSSLTVRITRPSAAGTFAFPVSSETLVTSGAEPGAPNALSPLSVRANSPTGTGLWLRIALDQPVTVYPNSSYGFDLTGIGQEYFFELHGIRDAAASGGDAYAGGGAYHGSTTATPDLSLHPLAGDRVFMVELNPSLEVVRDGRDVFLSWAAASGPVSQIDVYRNQRPTPEGRRRITTTNTATSGYLDSLPTDDAPAWYWVDVTRVDGTKETFGPATAASGPAGAPASISP
jgi:hypothetical protein